MDETPETRRLSGLAHRAVERCQALAACTEEEGIIRRACLTPAMARVHELVTGWMTAAGMDVRVDAIGNIAGRFGPADGRPLLIGSHLDTVRDAGPYDGILGVMLGIALVEALGPEPPPFPIEVYGFTGEEAARFPLPYIGSLAVAGALPEGALGLLDPDGACLADAITAFGQDPAELPRAQLPSARCPFATLELHIEQGPVLESRDLPVGVVTSLVGQRWVRFTFTGRAGHAGTTPMDLRRDPVPALAELTLAAEALARAEPGLVATIGRVAAHPGSVNVIAGEAILTLDIRHGDDAQLDAAVARLSAEAAAIATRRGLTLRAEPLNSAPATPCDPRLRALLRDAIAATGHRPFELPSGAGHDARVMARLAPTAMLFIRSPGGTSHHPEESVIPADVEVALAVAVDFVRRLDPALTPT